MIPKNGIPGLRFRILTPLYDFFLRMVIPEARIKSRLISQVNPGDHESILDFGCGTGTLTLMIKKSAPGCSVSGLDIDPKMLAIAEMKAERNGVDVRFVRYDGSILPFSDESFDKVVTSLVIHHLSTKEKPGIFRELHRVLKKGGELHILDFGIQRTLYAKTVTSFLQFLEPIGENLTGTIPEYLRQAGFTEAGEAGYENTLVGTVSFYRSKKIGSVFLYPIRFRNFWKNNEPETVIPIFRGSHHRGPVSSLSAGYTDRFTTISRCLPGSSWLLREYGACC